MTAMGNGWMQRYTLFASGMVSKGSFGGGGMDEGFGAVVLAAVLGAFCGLLFGLILSHVLQYVSFLMGRQVNGYCWTIVSALLGAVVFAWWAVVANGDQASLSIGEGLVEK
jgi:hypothetical protein